MQALTKFVLASSSQSSLRAMSEETQLTEFSKAPPSRCTQFFTTNWVTSHSLAMTEKRCELSNDAILTQVRVALGHRLPNR